MKYTRDFAVISIIILEIAYIFVTHENEYHLKSFMGEFQLWKIGMLSFLSLFMVALYFIAHKLRLNIFLFIVSVILLLFIYVNYKLKQNLILTDKTISIHDTISRMKTGDYILYRTPKTLETVF